MTHVGVRTDQLDSEMSLRSVRCESNPKCCVPVVQVRGPERTFLRPAAVPARTLDRTLVQDLAPLQVEFRHQAHLRSLQRAAAGENSSAWGHGVIDS